MLTIKQSCVLTAVFLLSVQMSYAFATSPTAPTDVVATRTSDTTVFISWSPSTDDVAVIGYNVFRDNDRQISTVTNPRLRDIQLAPDTTYTYYIVAFDADGNLSARSAVASTNETAEVSDTTNSQAQQSSNDQQSNNNTNENSASSDSSTPILVTGNRISWPDNGWYQVLDASNYTERCGGTQFCDVVAGRYLVINHSTGQRFPIVSVGAGNDNSINDNNTGSNVESTVVVSGMRISWPDNGWYQVQDTTNYAEQCGGTRFCDVVPGTYVVINHTTGERNNVVVQGDNTAGGSFINSGNALDQWANVVAVINAERVNSFFNTVEPELNFSGLTGFDPDGVSGVLFSEDTTIDPPYLILEHDGQLIEVPDQRTSTCSGGGRVLRYSTRQSQGFDDIYDNCALGGSVYRGTRGGRNLVRNAISRSPFTDFQQIASDGSQQIVDGEFFSGNESRVITNRSEGWRDLTFSDSTDGFQLTNYSIERALVDGGIWLGDLVVINGVSVRVLNYDKRETVKGQFAVSAPFTESQMLQVSVDLGFEDRVRVALDNPSQDFPSRNPEIPFEWQSGNVNIVASDGSSMAILPVVGNAFELTLGSGEVLGPFAWTDQFALSRLQSF